MYHDLFNLNEKFQSIRNFCEAEKFEIPKKKFDEVLKKDKQEFQAIFEKYQKFIEEILRGEENQTTQFALEFVLLTLLLMMICSGYLQDNYNSLKLPCPVITGKNFRNMLAHDVVLYETLTGFRAQNLIFRNAEVLARQKIKIYEHNRSKKVKIDVSNLEAACADKVADAKVSKLKKKMTGTDCKNINYR